MDGLGKQCPHAHYALKKVRSATDRMYAKHKIIRLELSRAISKHQDAVTSARRMLWAMPSGKTH